MGCVHPYGHAPQKIKFQKKCLSHVSLPKVAISKILMGCLYVHTYIDKGDEQQTRFNTVIDVLIVGQVSSI